MTRAASLFLPQLSIERLARTEPSRARPEPSTLGSLPIDDDPGACSVPRSGGWRPGARWATAADEKVRVRIAAAGLPQHQQPPMRELGRRSEPAPHPFRARPCDDAGTGGLGVRAGDWMWETPRILIATIGQKEVITAACPAALALGLRPGMAAAQARALVVGLDVRPADPFADAALLVRLGLHAARTWTPTAEVAGKDGLWLDLTGTSHLFGGEARFCRRVIAFCHRLGLTARIAVAGTPGAAHALARFGVDAVTIVPPGGEVQAIAPLPLAALRLSDEALAVAARFGLDRIADLLPLPRGPLAKRLGLATVARLDQATGRAAEPITGIVPFEPPVAERRLLEPIVTADSIAQVISDLTGDLIEILRERGLGARALDLALLRVDGTEQHIVFGTARATRDAGHLMRLLALRIDMIDPGLGIEASRLAATRAEMLDATSAGSLLTAERDATDMASLIDLLAGRIGNASLFRVAPVESDVPERAVRKVSPLSAPAGWDGWRRPARLLRRPEPLFGVVALLPDHPPRRFGWRGGSHIVVAGDGPERIHGEWWVRDGEMWAARDYYWVEDDAGARFWIFRRGDGVDPLTGDLSWHMHGIGG